MSRRYVMGGSRCHFSLSFFLMSLNAGNVNVEEYVKFSIFKFKMFVSLLSGSCYSGWYKPQTLQKKNTFLFFWGCNCISQFPRTPLMQRHLICREQIESFPQKELETHSDSAVWRHLNCCFPPPAVLNSSCGIVDITKAPGCLPF